MVVAVIDPLAAVPIVMIHARAFLPLFVAHVLVVVMMVVVMILSKEGPTAAEHDGYCREGYNLLDCFHEVSWKASIPGRRAMLFAA
jgi:hypothetical protein